MIMASVLCIMFRCNTAFACMICMVSDVFEKFEFEKLFVK